MLLIEFEYRIEDPIRYPEARSLRPETLRCESFGEKAINSKLIL